MSESEGGEEERVMENLCCILTLYVDVFVSLAKPKAEEGADRTAAAAAGGDGGSQDSEATALPYSIVVSIQYQPMANCQIVEIAALIYST